MKYPLLLFIVVVIFSCSKDVQVQVLVPPNGCDSAQMHYGSDIKPIISSYCSYSGCHSPGGEGAFDYTTYEGIANRLRAGRVLDRLALPVEDPLHMPEHTEMLPCDLYKLRRWIIQGFPDI